MTTIEAREAASAFALALRDNPWCGYGPEGTERKAAHGAKLASLRDAAAEASLDLLAALEAAEARAEGAEGALAEARRAFEASGAARKDGYDVLASAEWDALRDALCTSPPPAGKAKEAERV